MKLNKYLCHVLTVKNMSQMMEFVCWLIFIKIVPQAVKRLKKFVMIVMIEKDCNEKGYND